MNLTKGTQIYYTGDYANKSGFGTIIKVNQGKVLIAMDDEKIKNIPSIMIGDEYKGHCNPRFVTKKAWEEWREKQLEKIAPKI